MCDSFVKVNNVSAPPEEMPMAYYPEKLRSSRSHLDDESTNYDKPPYSYTPQWVNRQRMCVMFSELSTADGSAAKSASPVPCNVQILKVLFCLFIWHFTAERETGNMWRKQRRWHATNVLSRNETQDDIDVILSPIQTISLLYGSRQAERCCLSV